MSEGLIVRPIEYPCAWVTLVMCGDEYIAGAMVMARSLRQYETSYPVFLMVDGTQSHEMMELVRSSGLFHCIKVVPIIQHKSIRYAKPHIAGRYEHWVDSSYTKWNCFIPGIFSPFIVGKIMFVDADVLFLNNCDHLFELPAPAARFASPWTRPYGPGWSPYGVLTHGHPIFNESIFRALIKPERRSSSVCDGGMVLITPTNKLYKEFREILKRHEGKVYGNNTCKNGPDEQILVETIYNIGATFTNIHQVFNWMVGDFNFLNDWETEAITRKSKFPKPLVDDKGMFIPMVWHYHGPKPWHLSKIGTAETESQKRDEITMVKLYKNGFYAPWIDIANMIMKENPALTPVFSGIQNIPDINAWTPPEVGPIMASYDELPGLPKLSASTDELPGLSKLSLSSDTPQDLDQDVSKTSSVASGTDDVPQTISN